MLAYSNVFEFSAAILEKGLLYITSILTFFKFTLVVTDDDKKFKCRNIKTENRHPPFLKTSIRNLLSTRPFNNLLNAKNLPFST